MNVTIYHNPACGTSRNTLDLIRHAGIEPTVIEYLKTPPSKPELAKMIADSAFRTSGDPRKRHAYEELALPIQPSRTTSCSTP